MSWSSRPLDTGYGRRSSDRSVVHASFRALSDGGRPWPLGAMSGSLSRQGELPFRSDQLSTHATRGLLPWILIHETFNERIACTGRTVLRVDDLGVVNLVFLLRPE